MSVFSSTPADSSLACLNENPCSEYSTGSVLSIPLGVFRVAQRTAPTTSRPPPSALSATSASNLMQISNALWRTGLTRSRRSSRPPPARPRRRRGAMCSGTRMKRTGSAAGCPLAEAQVVFQIARPVGGQGRAVEGRGLRSTGSVDVREGHVEEERVLRAAVDEVEDAERPTNPR